MVCQKSIEENGFAVVPKVIEPGEIATILAEFPVKPQGGRAGERHLLSHQAVSVLAHDPRLLRIARGVLGKEACPFHATLFSKSYDTNWLVVWHQDTALPIRQRQEVAGWGPWSVKQGVTYAHAPAGALQRVLALRVHLDDSTESNGPLRVLAGTHRLGVLDDDSIHALATKLSSVECVVPRGGVLAMRPLLIHSSSKARTEVRRRVLHVEYAESLSIADGLELAVA